MDKSVELKELIFKLFEKHNILTEKKKTKYIIKDINIFDNSTIEVSELKYYVELEGIQYALNDYTGKLEIINVENEIVCSIELTTDEYKKFISLCNKKLQKSNDEKLESVIEKLKKLI